MATPSFVSGITTVSFARSITTPYSKSADKAQVRGETDGGQTYVYTKGSTIKHFKVGLPGLDQATFDALYSFWDTTVNGMATAFTFNDEDGTAYTTTHFGDNGFVWKKNQGPTPWYDVDILLRIG